MTRILFPLILLAFISSSQVKSQPSIPVDTYTGTALVFVPFTTLIDHDLSDNFGLVYQTKGVSIKSSAGFYGQGWNLAGGARVSRQVRGLPDDYNDPSQQSGWLYQSNVAINNFSNSADGSSSTCNDETTDYNQLQGYNYSIDPEPDIFYYSVGGLSGAFVFTNASTPTIALIPYRDIKIEPQFASATDKTINGFKITTANGVVYELNSYSTATKRARKYTGTTDVDFAKTDYELYRKKDISYRYEWLVDAVTSPSGARIHYNYVNESFPFVYDYQPDHTISVRVRGWGASEYYPAQSLYGWQVSSTVKKLVSA